jgi:hypothetical protein
MYTGQRAHYAHMFESDIHADPNAPQEHLDEINADLVGAPLGRKCAPQSFPRNIEGSRRLKRTVQTIWERRHGTSRASNAGLTLYRNCNLAYTCKH